MVLTRMHADLVFTELLSCGVNVARLCVERKVRHVERAGYAEVRTDLEVDGALEVDEDVHLVEPRHLPHRFGAGKQTMRLHLENSYLMEKKPKLSMDLDRGLFLNKL